jgi:GT2 family glycosyltransferase
MTAPRVSITIVTFNSARFISHCLRHVFEQDHPAIEIIIVDNSSTDGTIAAIEEYNARVKLVRNQQNVGFAQGHNQAIALSDGEWVLTLNPDVRLSSDFVSKAIAAGECDERIGSISGKLLRMSFDFEIPAKKVLDSTGIYFTPALRHFDRGSGEPDRGTYEKFEYVFGVTGAAGLYRRKMIEDISIRGEFFDNNFFAYREDADVAWRAQLLGWKCLYAPNAVAYHVRSVLPSNRASLPAAINMHSVKNRFLMRIKNITADLYFRHFFAISLRDLLVVGGCLVREWGSLSAFPLVIRSFRKALAERAEIMRRRRANSKYIAQWFCDKAVGLPAANVRAQAAATTVTPR